jgi:uncharacterized protein (TIGR03435 family)
LVVDAGRRVGFAILILAGELAAQQPVAPSFEVVSIHVVPPNAPPVERSPDFTPVLPGGRYVDSRAPLSWLIAFAYSVKFLDLQILGLPDWAKNQAFAIAAEAATDFPVLPPTENREQVRLMMRAMLADRFHLRMHSETRKGPMYQLAMAKGGVKISEVDPPVPPAKEGPVFSAWSDNDIRIIGKKSTMAGFATALTIMLHTLVVDESGLKGYYDFDVDWRDQSTPEGPPGAGFSASGIGFLISNLQSRLGLRLRKTTGPMGSWVVDHVERPTEN